MSSPIDPEQWTIIDHTNTMATSFEAQAQPQTEANAPVSEPKIELTINAKPNSDTITPPKKDAEYLRTAQPALDSKPTLDRQDTVNTKMSYWDEEDAWYTDRSRPRRRAPGRRDSRSPIRIHERPPPETMMVISSTALLAKVSAFDGIADLPYPSRSSVFLTTFPFTDKEVQKYAWLFNYGVEDEFMQERTAREMRLREFDDDEWYGARPVPMNHFRPARGPHHGPVGPMMDLPSIFLSRALNASVIPDDEKDVTFWIVVQNKARSPGSKLLVAESRKAVGIMIFYEALVGNSIAFVGAVKGQQGKKMRGMKLKKVDTLNEAVSVQSEDGIVGVVC